jgi:hypothetical protein
MTDTTTKVREHYSGIGLADSHQGGPHDDRARKSDAHGRCAVNTSNQALELTTARSVSTSSMTTSFPPDLTLAPSGRSSA